MSSANGFLRTPKYSRVKRLVPKYISAIDTVDGSKVFCKLNK